MYNKINKYKNERIKKMNRILTRLIVVGYIAILAFIVHSVFWSLDDELLMTIISIIIQSAMILYLTISNWNEGKEKIISPGPDFSLVIKSILPL